MWASVLTWQLIYPPPMGSRWARALAVIYRTLNCTWRHTGWHNTWTAHSPQQLPFRTFRIIDTREFSVTAPLRVQLDSVVQPGSFISKWLQLQFILPGSHFLEKEIGQLFLCMVNSFFFKKTNHVYNCSLFPCCRSYACSRPAIIFRQDKFS